MMLMTHHPNCGLFENRSTQGGIYAIESDSTNDRLFYKFLIFDWRYERELFGQDFSRILDST